MSLFQPSFYGGDPIFTNLFRFLDDFESYSRGDQDNTSQVTGLGRHGRRHVYRQLFSPKFDIYETDTTYELDGELPGIERKDVVIEFTEPQTLVVRGRVEDAYASGTAPTELIEGPQTSDTVGADKETHDGSGTEKPTEAAKEDKSQGTERRYWHQERSVGEFHRTFTFPASIDDSGVSATLNNGILHITVPKVAKHESRRIAIN